MVTELRRERSVRWAAGAGPQVNDRLQERKNLGQAQREQVVGKTAFMSFSPSIDT